MNCGKMVPNAERPVYSQINEQNLYGYYDILAAAPTGTEEILCAEVRIP